MEKYSTTTNASCSEFPRTGHIAPGRERGQRCGCRRGRVSGARSGLGLGRSGSRRCRHAKEASCASPCALVFLDSVCGLRPSGARGRSVQSLSHRDCPFARLTSQVDLPHAKLLDPRSGAGHMRSAGESAGPSGTWARWDCQSPARLPDLLSAAAPFIADRPQGTRRRDG
jgi:hypothetical protein